MGEQSAASNDQFPSSEVAPWSLVLSSAKLVSLKAPQFTLLMKHVLRTTLSTPAAHTRVFLHDKSFYPGCTTHIPSKSGPRPGYGCSPWAEAEEAQCWQQAFHLSSFFFFSRNSFRENKQTPDPSQPLLTNSHPCFNSCSSSAPVSLETLDSWLDRKNNYFSVSSEHSNTLLI